VPEDWGSVLALEPVRAQEPESVQGLAGVQELVRAQEPAGVQELEQEREPVRAQEPEWAGV
jgi:hypothetical protein